METLLTPDKGLIIWTIVTFMVLVFVLGKVGWKPILEALKSREEGIRRAIEEAQAARQAAEQMKASYEKDLAAAQAKAQAMVTQAQAEAQKLREKLMKDAEADVQRLRDQTQRQLEEEKAKLVRELRKEVAGLSILAAEKLVRHTMSPKVQDELLEDFFKDLDEQKTKPLN